MKAFLILSLTALALSAEANELGGLWQDSDTGSTIRFVSVKGMDRFTSTQKFVHPNGNYLYSTTKILQVPRTGKNSRMGSISYYDSRGCSFENLPVNVEFQTDDEVNLLITTPRYKFQTLTTTRDEYNTCRTAAGYYYRCGRPRPTVSHRCKILDYIQEPFALSRHHR
jgi:hypothetical protein